MAYTFINVLLRLFHVVCLWFFLRITVFLVLQLNVDEGLFYYTFYLETPPKYFFFPILL